MEKFQQSQKDAIKHLQVADHMLYITYPVVKDNKLLMSITENIFLALTKSMASVLYYERLFKRVPPFHETFDSKFNLFETKIVRRYKIDEKFIRFISVVKDIIQAHKNSQVEFSRPDKYVICVDNYKMKTITVDKLKDYIHLTKEFLAITKRLVDKNAFIFRTSP
jgi:hypothetical protein